MPRGKSDRRKFLNRALGAAGAASVAALAAPGAVLAKKNPARKQVVTRGGQPLPPEALFSPAIRFGNLLFVSGVGAHDPQTHKVVEGPFPNQVRQCLDNLKAVVEAAGSSMTAVLKCTVFLTDIANFQAMNQVYHTYFTTDPPARSTVAVKELPGESPIEIECFAHVD
ncbi:MAG: Rid family detoxifying hydrolase [Acidobacteriia bacterium]|nr:Rid family detoxifying hydrolase [Terriglobia bacterium]